MRRNIVEGEPGIFPAPIASVLRAFGRLFRRDKRQPPQQPPGPDHEGEPSDES
jgi:hypothetical protein